MTNTMKLLGLGALALLVACGGAASEGDTETTPDTTETAAIDPNVIPSPPTPWEEMSFDEKKSWMVREVTPRIGPMFEAYDAERFAGFSCEGCHGEDAQERNYAMPNAGIFTLYATGSQEQVDMVNDMRPMVNFMFREVVPAMKTLLGAPDYDTETGEGFGCFACHPDGGEGTPANAEQAFLMPH